MCSCQIGSSCCHADMDQTLWGIITAPCWIYELRLFWRQDGSNPVLARCNEAYDGLVLIYTSFTWAHFSKAKRFLTFTLQWTQQHGALPCPRHFGMHSRAAGDLTTKPLTSQWPDLPPEPQPLHIHTCCYIPWVCVPKFMAIHVILKISLDESDGPKLAEWHHSFLLVLL